jgi:hypothetical protein
MKRCYLVSRGIVRVVRFISFIMILSPQPILIQAFLLTKFPDKQNESGVSSESLISFLASFTAGQRDGSKNTS